MASNVEMTTVNVNTPGTTNVVGTNQYQQGWFYHWWNTGHAFIALVFALIGIAAAVGLGSGDWYVWEASTAEVFNLPSGTYGGPYYYNGGALSGSYFATAYYGLRYGYVCSGPASPISSGANHNDNNYNGQPNCAPYTYRSKYLYFDNACSNLNGANDVYNVCAARTAFFHLIGASGIIIALLAVVIVISAHQFLHNAFASGGVGLVYGRISPKISLVIVLVLELLVIIFWVTIFPYTFVYNSELALVPAGVATYDIYRTLGVGFAIQIGGFLAGLWGLFWFPKELVIVRQTAV